MISQSQKTVQVTIINTMDESQSQQPWEIAQTEPLLNHPNNNNNSNEEGGRTSLDSNRSSLDPNDTTLPLSPNTQFQLNDMASRASNTGDNTNNTNDSNTTATNSTANNNSKMSNEDELNRLLKLLSPTTSNTNNTNNVLNEEDGAALLSYLTKLRTGNSTSSNSSNSTSTTTDDMEVETANDEPASNNGACETSQPINNEPIKWSANNVQLIKLTVKSVMNSFNTSSSSGVASSSNSMEEEEEVANNSNNNNTVTIDNKLALRLLSEGILPFSGVNTNNGSGSGGGLVSSSEEGGNEGTWVAKLIQSIVMENLLPTALLSPLSTEGSAAASENASEGDSGANQGSTEKGNGGTNVDTTALSILLSAFLTRMDSDEMLQVLPPSTTTSTTNDNVSAFGSVDDILDRLCGVTTTTSGSGTSEGGKEILHPSSAAAVLASLIEFENNASSVIGGSGSSSGSRLSRKRIWKRTTSSISSTTTTSSNNNQGLSQRRKKGRSRASLPTQQQNQQQMVNYEAQYVYIDRPTYLISTCLVCLTKLSGGRSKICTDDVDVDYDLIPSLVYQLGLLPMNMVSRTSSGSGGSSLVAAQQTKGGGKNKKKKVKKENDKQRGLRLRRMILEGIATVLDDDDNDVNSTGESGSGGILLAASSSSNNTKKNSLETKEAYKWAKYTSLEHLGRVLRTDPDMSKAVLSLLSGDIVDTTSFTTSDDGSDTTNKTTKNQKPFRYSRLTPFTLAMSLSMASAVPRMRTPTLSAIRDLIVEEQMIRIKRGLDVNGNVIGMGKPWLNCLVQSLDGSAPSSDSRNSTPQKQNENGIGHVLTCLLSVAKFAEGENSGVGMSSLLQSLSTLGFLLVDCVKKDELSSLSTLPSFTSDSSVVMQPTPVLASNLDISSFNPNNNNNKNNVDTSAPHATSVIGRFLLSYLYYQGAKNSSHFTSSSLASMSTIGGGSSSDNGGTGLCRSILRTSFDKFCGMSPNAYEHSLLLQDLLKFSPISLNHLIKDDNDDNNSDNMMGGMDGLDDEQKQMVISFNLTSNHLPALIDTLANVPGGAMHPTVASEVVVPTIGRLLFLMATSRIGLGTLWKRHDLEDHVNHAFLLCKKALFAPDVEKRKCAANLLVMLLGVATVASTSTSSSSSRSVWSSMLYDMKGCLRRCLSNHQNVVRMEVYSSLVALLPKTMPSNGDMSLSAASQDSASPASSTASSPLSAASSTITSSWNTIVQSIPSSGQHAIVCIVSELLLSSLERYVTIPKEEFTDRNARRQRSAMGVGLSQMEMVMEEESPVQKGDDDNEEMSNPFRFDKCISTRPSAANTQSSSGKKKAKNTPIGQSLLTEALKRINEPLPFLLASCISTSPLISCDGGDTDDEEDSQTNEMKKAIKRIRQQMAECSDIDEYTKWTKTCKNIMNIEENIKRSEEMAISKLASLVLVAVTIDVMIGTVDLKGETNGASLVVMDGSGSGGAANEVEDLFTLRTDAIDMAAVIMSSFVNSKPSKKKATTKKSKKKLKEATNSQSSEQPSPEKKKKSSSAKSGGEMVLSKVKTSDIPDSIRLKNRKLVEDTINNISPAMSSEFLAESLRKFGAEAMRKICEDEDSDDDEEGEGEPATRLAKCLAFRRYIITKSLLFTTGSSSLVKAGFRFTPLSLGSGESGGGFDEKTESTIRITTSLPLGQLLLVEFCSHCYQLEQTSIVSSSNSKKSSSSSLTELSLAQLSMRAFTACLRGMAKEAPHHSMSKAMRVLALLTTSINKTSKAIPASSDGWKFYQELDDSAVSCINGTADDKIKLAKALMPILSLPKTSGSNTDGESSHISLFSELIYNCMYGEATECCYLVSAAAEALEEPNLKEQLGVMLLRGVEFGGGENDCGVLGVDHSDEANHNSSVASTAIRVAMKLNCGLDGNTQVPLLSSSKGLPGVRLRTARSLVGLPTTCISNWPTKHQGRLTRESTSGIMVGLATQIAWALSATIEAGDNFSHIDLKKKKLLLIKHAMETSDVNFGREKSAIGTTISSAIEDALNNAEFTMLKMIPSMPDDSSIDTTQSFVSGLLFTVSQVIHATAPSAEFLDTAGSYISLLLKSTKRLYGILAKLVLSFINNTQSVMNNKEFVSLLEYLTETLMPTVSTLLLTLQKHNTEAEGGKIISESKIESYGKISALLVFEKEKLGKYSYIF